MPHGLDVYYLFGLSRESLPRYKESGGNASLPPQELGLSRMYGDMIGAFVATGNPNHWLHRISAEEWLQYETTNETFLSFSQNLSIGSHLHSSTASLWIDLVPRLHSRWRQQTTATTNETATQAPVSQSGKLTNLGLTESEANTALIALIVVCGLLVVLNIGLMVVCSRICKPKGKGCAVGEKGIEL